MHTSNSLAIQPLKRIARLFCVCLVVLLLVSFGSANSSVGQKIEPKHLKFFEAKIRPVLIRECYSCHSDQAGQQKGGLRLDTKARSEIGGDSGPAVVPFDLEDSLLWNAINHQDFAMPPRKKLPDRDIANFKTWIEMGAPDPRKSKANKVQSTVTEADIKAGRQFWSFRRPKTPVIPKVDDPSWPRNSIDHFVGAGLAKENLSPAQDADPNSFLRRLSNDLIGLPPTAEQVKWFEKKWAEDPDSAIRKVVDHLLASERFGERWGRHWLDVARFGESTGRELNATFPNAWRYRDYVIDSFNTDKPYDEFVQEQVAGDLLPAKNDQEWAEHLIATGFLAVGPKTLREQNARQFNLDLADEQIDVTTRVVLGVSVACARCHDHKFDPIQQKDYYAMAGIFESTSTHYGTLDNPQNRRPSNQLVLPVSDPSPFDATLSEEEVANLTNELARLKTNLAELQKERREARKKPNTNAVAQNNANINRAVTRIAFIESRLDSVDDAGKPVSFCMGVQDKAKPNNARLLIRGEFDQPDETIKRGFVKVLNHDKSLIKSNSSGRLELAKWLTHKKNPLTARVMANRIWLHMFGKGIVATPENFGATGLPPTHPELLDFLAIEFAEHDWSIKNLIRQIANSRTYRMNSAFDSEKYEIDAENDFLWRANPQQMDAESLRDAMLFASGALNTNRPRASVVAEAGSTIVRDGKIASVNVSELAKDSMSMTARRRRDVRRNTKIFDLDESQEFRSVYLPIVRDSLPRALEVFDFAEPGMVVGQRETSNTPSQGLYLLNNEFVIEQSKELAKRLIAEAETTSERIQLAFLLAYGRDATDQELSAAMRFYDEFDARKLRRDKSEVIQLRKLAALAQGIFASAEFRYTN